MALFEARKDMSNRDTTPMSADVRPTLWAISVGDYDYYHNYFGDFDYCFDYRCLVLGARP